MIQKWVAGLQGKTGRTLDEWIALVKKDGPKSEVLRREWLKSKHKHGTNSALWIAARAEGRDSDEDTPEKYLAIAPKYVDEQYSGKKESLRPIYEQVLGLAAKIGADVKACPGKTIVPLYRNHVFAQIKPTTNTRVDLGLALARYRGKYPKRVIDTGGLAKKDRITHRIALSSISEVDQEVGKWLETAYELDEN